MGKLALAHRGRSRVLPTADLLEPHLDRTATHWYWLGEFTDDGLDRSAYFDWAPPFEPSTRWVVPRLLWQLANPAVTARRVLLENVCGLYTCVNPAHWRPRRGGVVIPSRIVLPGGVDASPCMSPMAVLTVHVRYDGATSTVCGRSARDLRGLDMKAAVTCDECISAWIRTGKTYVEAT